MATMIRGINQLSRGDLLPLERYAIERDAFRARAIEHKRNRRIALGAHMTLLFEDRLTVQYQIQEMLRSEKIFEPEAIQEEIDAYNPLIPDGQNLKATLLIEYPDSAVRQFELERLRGIEHRLCAVVENHPPVFVHADEDLGRSNESKTSAVHFLRFEFDANLVAALKAGAALDFAVEDPRYPHRTRASAVTRAALLGDFA